jgi:hypothetical protein
MLDIGLAWIRFGRPMRIGRVASDLRIFKSRRLVVDPTAEISYRFD